jgi:carbon-monoxide dehydrogenase medium subunit
MLNLRLAQPEALIDIAPIAQLRTAVEQGDAVSLGAGITHALIEDGKIIDPTGGFLKTVAANIAYRAIRNRGTLGGSLAHADPAADWVTVMRLLDATYLIQGEKGTREVASGAFMKGAFTTALEEHDILTGVRINKCSPKASFGYFKFCRKVGEFAEAIGAVMIDPVRNVKRAVIGATASRPHLVNDIEGVLRLDTQVIRQEVLAAGCVEAYDIQTHVTALKRAIAQALAAKP